MSRLPPGRPPEPPPLQPVIDQWLAMLQARRHRALIIHNHEVRLDLYFKPFLQETGLQVTLIRRQEALRFRSWLEIREVSRPSRNLVLATLSAFYGYLREQGLVRTNPFRTLLAR